MKYFHPYVWFLSYDPVENAKFLSDRDLQTNILHIVHILLSTYLYNKGLRNDILASKLFKNDKDYFILTYFPYFPDIKKYISFVPLKKCKALVKWLSTSNIHFNIFLKHLDAQINEYDTRLHKGKHGLRFLEDYFIQYPSATSNIIYNNSNLEYILNLTYKFPTEFKKSDIIKTIRNVYKARHPKGKLFSKYSQDIPEWLLE